MPGSGVRMTLAITGPAGSGGTRSNPAAGAQVHRAVRGGRVLVTMAERLVEQRGDLAVLDDELAAVPGALRFEVVVEQHEVGPPSAAQAAEFAIQPVARGGVQRTQAPRPRGRQPGFQRLPRHPVQPEGEHVVRIPVVRADADALRVRAEFRHGLDGLGQRMPRRGRRPAAQENPQAASSRSSAMSRSMASCVSVTPLAAYAATNSRP